MKSQNSKNVNPTMSKVFKKLISHLLLIKENDVCVAVYVGISLILLMLVATSENILLIIIAVANLYVGVRQLNKIDENRMP